MFTLGYPFRPWTGAKAIADGPAILAYLRETAREYGIDRHIRFGHRVVARRLVERASARWTVEVEATAPARGAAPPDAAASSSCAAATTATTRATRRRSPGAEDFTGPIVHPQHWPEDLDVAGKRIVVIGSGATAVTLVPALAESAAHVTMLQRSPTWILSRPSEDRLAKRLRRWLPRGAGAPASCAGRRAAHACTSSELCRAPAERAQALLLARRAALDGAGLRRSTRTSRRATTRGTSASAWCPTATCSGRCGRPGVDRHRRDRALHADRHAPESGDGARRRPDRHRHRPDAPGLRRRRDQRRRPRRSTGRAALDLQGRDVQRRAQPGLVCSATPTPPGP